MPTLLTTLNSGPIGAELVDIDVARPLDAKTAGAIEALLDERSVLVIRQQTLSAQALVTFAQRFGQVQANVRDEVRAGGEPGVTLVSNIAKDGKPLGSHDAGRYWHSDLCYMPRPSKITFLHALEVPAQDGVSLGDTQFSSMAAAHDALSGEIRQRLARLRAANGYRYMWNKKAHEFGKRPVLSEQELEKYPADAVHPVVRTHPVTGRKCLYVNEGYTRCILDLAQHESQTMLEMLCAQVVRPEFIHRHQWRVGDLLMWDNCAVQHKATFDYEHGQRRLLQRCVTEGPEPV